MPLSFLEAQQFNKVLSSGRTLPCLISCSCGNSEELADYVVKLRNSLDTRETGLIAELTASLFGKKLGLNVPEPALISISDEFANSVSDDHAKEKLKKSVGLNFGSYHLTEGYVVWPKNEPIPASLLEKAAEILAFDALIQNFDRRPEKPNLLWKGDELVIIDHEGAFSFLQLIGQRHAPWTIDAFSDIVRQHLFFRPLKGKAIGLGRFRDALCSIKAKDLEEIFEKIPTEWRNPKIEMIADHLSQLIQFATKFVEGVKGVIL